MNAGRHGQARAGWVMTGPALAAILVFFILPAAASLALSFTDFDIYALADTGNLRFVGLQNYERLLENPLFWKATTNSLLFVAIGTPFVVALSLFAAILVNRSEEHTSELQSLMRNSYAVFCLKKKNKKT